jgi:hypothetical protein
MLDFGFLMKERKMLRYQFSIFDERREQASRF